MKRQDLFELAGRNLREALLRNSLTALGVAVGVASLVAMLSLGVGLQELAGARLQRSGLFDSVVVFSRRDIRSFDRAERRTMTTAEARALDEDARREMEKMPGVVEVNGGGPADFGEEQRCIRRHEGQVLQRAGRGRDRVAAGLCEGADGQARIADRARSGDSLF
jgi:hypothetical protein